MKNPEKIWWRAGFALLGSVLLVLLALAPYVQFLWLRELGQQALFWTMTWTRAVLFLVGATAGGLSTGLSLAYAERNWPAMSGHGPVEVEVRGTRVIVVERDRFPKWLVPASIAMGSLALGLSTLPMALPTLLFLHRASFSQPDPLFGEDPSLYLFVVPFLGEALARLDACILIAAVAGLLYYAVRGSRRLASLGTVPAPVIRHLGLLVGTFLITRAPVFFLERWDLVITGSGPAAGAGYVDATVRSPALLVLAISAVVAGCYLLIARQAALWKQLAAIGAVVLLGVLGQLLVPAVVQRWVVAPNEIAMERPYIEHGIERTNVAYGLSSMKVLDYPAGGVLSPQRLAAHRDTLNNVRLWDPEPLLDAYKQLQSLRPYYDFPDVDVDRYTVEGRARQVMLAAREIPSRGGDTWVNQRLKFTHGYGAAMSPVTEVTSEGLPRFWIKDLPPVTLPDVPVQRPEIYYGELTDWYVLAGSKEQELDYGKGESNVYAHYEGSGGVPIGGFLRRALLSLYFGDMNILISQAVTPQTRLMFWRDIATRLEQLVPFLEIDPDPYLVLSGGRFYWIVDLYTTSDRYPYSRHLALSARGWPRRLNYVRNSVKAVVDAYDGKVRLFATEERDPVLETYRRVFPTLFSPLEELEPELRAHIRYPDFFLRVQADVFLAYHMKDAQVFYNREDTWELPQEKYNDKIRAVQPYYVMMKLPGQRQLEFLLMLPFTPKGKDNMIAWLAARCDGPHYGELLLYQFPKDSLVYGPQQIEARIDQDTVISQQLTLWDQRGSQIIRGNLLVIPIEDSLLYVEPLYLQGSEAKIPELKRVIVATANAHSTDAGPDSAPSTVVMRPTFAEALAAVTGTGEASADRQPETSPQLPGAPPPTDAAGKAAEALRRMEAAEKALGGADWERFGSEMKAARELLEQIARPR
ncbi:MAG: UPF0182 family protein [Armatimonadetes bacterium]|nr:UPF0182 family protein [Armatimonadota bacterium]